MPFETDSEVNKKSPDIRKIIRHRRQCRFPAGVS
jgi:hypothetical protein